MHWKDFLIGLRLVGLSFFLGIISFLIYPFILRKIGWGMCCFISPTILIMFCVLLLAVGMLVIFLSLMVDDDKQ